MSRPLRIEFPGAVYHVMNRGLNRNSIFLENKDYELFGETLGQACRLFNVELYAYCLMPNHYHLLVSTPLGNISRFMRHLNGVYTQRFNRKYQCDGPLFRGRFKSILVQEDSYLLQVVRYIHKNPVKAKIVDRLNRFKWSSHNSYLGMKGLNCGLDTGFVLLHFSGTRKLAVERYKHFMAEPDDESTEKFYASKKQGSILGSAEFIETIKKNYLLDSPDIEVQEKRKICGEGLIQNIKQEVCRTFGVDEQELLHGRRGIRNIPRQAALLLSKELSGLTLAEIGPHFGLTSYRTVGTHCFRFQEQMDANKTLRSKYTTLRKTCSQERT